jgi:gluconolactonase
VNVLQYFRLLYLNAIKVDQNQCVRLAGKTNPLQNILPNTRYGSKLDVLSNVSPAARGRKDFYLKPARKIASDVGFTEGPVLRANGDVVFVSLDHGRLYQIVNGKTTVLAELPGGPNGATEGIDGTIYVAQNGGRWGGNKHPDWRIGCGVQSVAKSGAIGWASADPISPNDLCFGPDGLLYVTDPTRYRPARDDGRIFRIDVTTGESEILCSLPWFPNGIGFGLEDDALYVAQHGPLYQIMRFPLDNGRLGKPEAFTPSIAPRMPDGFLFDTEGNLTTAAPSHGDELGEIQTFDRNGKLIDAFSPDSGKLYTNVALNSERTLIVTAAGGGSVLAIDDWPHAGLPLHPFRKR